MKPSPAALPAPAMEAAPAIGKGMVETWMAESVGASSTTVHVAGKRSVGVGFIRPASYGNPASLSGTLTLQGTFETTLLQLMHDLPNSLLTSGVTHNISGCI